MSDHGKFVWHDLMSADVEKSTRFYGELFNWSIKKEDSGPYTLIKSGEEHVGGILPLPMPNMPPHWIGYVSVPSVDKACAQAKDWNGKVIAPKMEIPNVGTFAVIGDPQGGVSAPFTSSHGDTPEREGKPPVGVFCWDELYTPDPDNAAAFYSQVYEWSRESMEMPGMGTYHIYKRGEKNAGGMLKPPPGTPNVGHWLSYVAVANCDETTARVTKLGGQVLMPGMDVPNVGRFAVLRDNGGAVFGVLAG